MLFKGLAGRAAGSPAYVPGVFVGIFNPANSRTCAAFKVTICVISAVVTPRHQPVPSWCPRRQPERVCAIRRRARRDLARRRPHPEFRDSCLCIPHFALPPVGGLAQDRCIILL